MDQENPKNLPPEVLEVLAEIMNGEAFEAQSLSGEGPYSPPPDLRNVKIDFSQFHMMDHPIWRCHGYGGPRKHAYLAWQFRWKPYIQTQTLCRVGLHKATVMWRMKGSKPVYMQRRCVRCGRALGMVQKS